MTRRRLLAVGLAVLLGAGLGYVGASALVWDRLTRVGGDCPADLMANDPTRYTAGANVDESDYAMPPPEDVRLPSRDPGITVAGWYVAAADPEAPAIIVVHGHTSCRREGGVLLAAGMLHQHGFSVLLMDLRDHGDSTLEDGRFAGGTDEHRDVLGAWDWLQSEKDVPPEQIGLVGFSLGAATVTIAGGEEPRVAAVWADSGYADIREAIRAELDRNGYPTILAPAGVAMARILSGDDLASFSPLAGARKMGGRALFVTHGTDDGRLSVEYARELTEAARTSGARVESWIVPGAGHTQAITLHPAEYEQRLERFFRSSLGG